LTPLQNRFAGNKAIIMKNPILLLSLILTCFCQESVGQNNAVVHYQEIITMNMQIPEDLPQEMKDKIPNQRVNKFDLSYIDKEAFYCNAKENDNQDLEFSSGDENEQFNFKIATPKFEVYTNRGNDRHIESREFLGKTFLIKDKCRDNNWKVTSERKSVMGVPCIKAIDGNNLSVWFAPSIKVPHGPMGFGGLPGLILALEDTERNIEIVATKIESDSSKKEDMIQPKKGKKVSRDEYNAIVEKKMEEMGAQGSGGIRVITIEEED